MTLQQAVSALLDVVADRRCRGLAQQAAPARRPAQASSRDLLEQDNDQMYFVHARITDGGFRFSSSLPGVRAPAALRSSDHSWNS